MITNISDRKDTIFLSYNNTLSVEMKFHWQIIAFFLLYRWHSYINNVSLLYIRGNIARKDDFKNKMPLLNQFIAHLRGIRGSKKLKTLNNRLFSNL